MVSDKCFELNMAYNPLSEAEKTFILHGVQVNVTARVLRKLIYNDVLGQFEKRW